MARRYGWAPRGKRLIDAAPFGHWRATTFVAGLRHDNIIAPCVIDGPITGKIFRTYVRQFLVPILHNLPAHKAAGVEAMIREAGASLMYLPPCSPDLHPIEQAFAKLKAMLRKTAARTQEAIWTGIGQLFDHFSPQECRNYLENSGYAFE